MIQRFFRSLRRSEAGSTATEYMLIIAVVVLGLIAAASKLIPFFESGVETLGKNISENYLTNDPSYEKVTIEK